MSSTAIEAILPTKLVQALANALFPALDSALRAGRHITQDELDYYALLTDFQQELTHFYWRYHVELIRAPEGFFYLRPRSTTLIARAVLSELEMLVGKVLCYLYLSPERVNQQGIFSQQDFYQELYTLVDQERLLKLVNYRATGSDRDRQKVVEKVNSAFNRLRRLGMVVVVGSSRRFRITEAVFRFAADVRSGEALPAAQRRLVQAGEAVIAVPPPAGSVTADRDHEKQQGDDGDDNMTAWEQDQP